MVREVVHLQVGQCGNQVGTVFFDKTMKEHKLDNGGVYVGGDEEEEKLLSMIDVYFREVSSKGAREKRFTTRSIIVDLEPGTADVIRQKKIAGMFNPDNFISGNNGAGNNWAKGHYTEGAEIVDQVLDVTRREMEKCECMQAVQLFHSLGGGTGSGLGTLILLKVRDAYPDKITCTYSVFPSPKVSDTVVEPYNAVLSSHQLLENADETFIIDNEALYNIAHNVLKQSEPKYTELNDIIGQVVCGTTASLRFSGQLNADLRKLGVNLVPFPRLHFFLVSQAPLNHDVSQSNINVKELISQAYSPRNFLSNVKAEDGKYLAAGLTFRGSITSQQVDDEIKKFQENNSDSFVEWIPNNMKTSIVTVPSKESDQSATFVANTTALKGIFQRLATQFGAMYKRKAFLHWYKGEGMDEMEFQEADKNVRDLITEYQDKQDAEYEGDEEDESDV